MSDFDWDKEYSLLVTFYAELALKNGWVEYVRETIKEKQKNESLLKNLGKDVSAKIKELKNENSLNC